MTIITKTSAKKYFLTGAFPTQGQFADTIDSYLGLGESGNQTVGGPITFSAAVAFQGGITVSGSTGLYGDITFGTSAASTARTSMGLGTAAVLNTGVSANNLPKLDSSNRLPAVDGSLLTNLPASPSDVTCYQVTDSTDISLSAVPTQANVGSSFSVNIPTKGSIELNFSGEIITSGVNKGICLGIRIGSTNYWPSYTEAGTPYYHGDLIEVGTGTGVFSSYAGGLSTRVGFAGGIAGAMMTGLQIEALSIPTGTQTVQIIAACDATTVTIKGTVVTTRVNMRVFDHS